VAHRFFDLIASIQYSGDSFFLYRNRGDHSFKISSRDLSHQLLKYCSLSLYERLKSDLVENFQKSMAQAIRKYEIQHNEIEKIIAEQSEQLKKSLAF